MFLFRLVVHGKIFTQASHAVSVHTAAIQYASQLQEKMSRHPEGNYCVFIKGREAQIKEPCI